MFKKIGKILLVSVMIVSLCPMPIYADGDIEISSAKELLKMKENPSGSYVLTENIDMKDVKWEPFEFSGSLNGNGHCILNIDVQEKTDSKKDVVDANVVHYEAVCNGLFTTMTNASITNIQLLGIHLEGNVSDNVFYGLLAGYADSCWIQNISISGYCNVNTNGHCIGVGGLLGFSRNNTIQNCTIESTLKSVDTNVADKDEQFMGGVFAFGYGNVTDCFVVIDGYDSDHGYVHDGGLIGTFMHYEYDNYECGDIHGNKVRGQIYFFEDNEDRRAYCEAIIGEIMDQPISLWGNTDYFTRNETFEYGTDLDLHSNCMNPDEIQLEAEAGFGKVGYTMRACNNCGFTQKSNYTLPFEGQLTHPAYKNWEEPAVGSTDILVISTHADDEQLFFSGILPYYTKVRDLDVQVVYGTDHVDLPVRHTERENGLWAVGVTHYPESSGWQDQYSLSLEEALANFAQSDGISEDDIVEWMHQIILKYKPQVIITHDFNGEYGHGQHQVMAYALNKAIERHSDEYKDFLKKAYIHLYGENTVNLNWMDTKYAQLYGMTPFNVTQQYGFVEHETQLNSWFYEWLYGSYDDVRNAPITQASQIATYSPMQWGMIYGDTSLDVNHNDFFEGLTSYREMTYGKKERVEEKSSNKEEKKESKTSIFRIILNGIAFILLLFIVVILIIRRINLMKRKKRRKKRKQILDTKK